MVKKTIDKKRNVHIPSTIKISIRSDDHGVGVIWMDQCSRWMPPDLYTLLCKMNGQRDWYESHKGQTQNCYWIMVSHIFLWLVEYPTLFRPLDYIQQTYRELLNDPTRTKFDVEITSGIEEIQEVLDKYKQGAWKKHCLLGEDVPDRTPALHIKYNMKSYGLF